MDGAPLIVPIDAESNCGFLGFARDGGLEWRGKTKGAPGCWVRPFG